LTALAVLRMLPVLQRLGRCFAVSSANIFIPHHCLNTVFLILNRYDCLYFDYANVFLAMLSFKTAFIC